MKNTILLMLACIGLSAVAQQRYSIVIHEIMADPSPEVGLPGNEWIELYNRSAETLNLRGLRIGDATGESGMLPNYTLPPGAYVIICTGSAVSEMRNFGPTISVTSFPSLGNEADLVYLKSPAGNIIHAVQYELSWYQNALKQEGGWTLEMIDPALPCSGAANWSASTAATGGTPGVANAVHQSMTDNKSPVARYAYTLDAYTIILSLDEPVDSAVGSVAAHYRMDNGITVSAAVCLPPLFDKIKLSLQQPMQEEKIYTVTVNSLSDCLGNSIANPETLPTGLPGIADSKEIVINELLFNPQPDGDDYIELYNRSKKIMDLSGLHLANRNSAGDINAITKLLPTPRYIFPGEYAVITTDADNLAKKYLVKDKATVITVSSLPSYPDDKGTVILLNNQGGIIDELVYREDWHFSLIKETEGISLERIDPDDSTQKADNWHSAATTAGYGTPGYQNSQYKKQVLTAAVFEVTPRIFSPDNDGDADIATLQYQVTEPGFLANVTIFDAAGRPVRNLVRSALLGRSGYWNWDGMDDKKQALPIGPYIIFVELFNTTGHRERLKQTVVLARRL